MSAIYNVGTSTGGIEVNIYLSDFFNAPVIELMSITGRLAFLQVELPEVLKLLDLANLQADALHHNVGNTNAHRAESQASLGGAHTEGGE